MCRNRQLEGISVVAQEFHEALEPLNEWLTAVEKRLANSEPIGTQAPKLEEQIAQHKVRCRVSARPTLSSFYYFMGFVTYICYFMHNCKTKSVFKSSFGSVYIFICPFLFVLFCFPFLNFV